MCFSGVLVANKTDKENYRMVSTQEGKQLATSRKLGFFECSAVNNNNNIFVLMTFAFFIV